MVDWNGMDWTELDRNEMDCKISPGRVLSISVSLFMYGSVYDLRVRISTVKILSPSNAATP